MKQLNPSTTIDREPCKVIAAILQGELELKDGQVMLSFEKFNIPAEDQIYIAVTDLGGKAISSVNRTEPNGSEGLTEIQELVMRHVIQIDIMSLGDSHVARTRKEEVPMALRSLASQALQERFQMQIARLPTEMLDASGVEEVTYLTRYTTTIVVAAIHRKTKSADFFDSFRGQFRTDESQKPIEIPPKEQPNG